MKRMKKLMSIMLAIVMVLAMSTAVFASETEAYPGSIESAGKITISNAVVGETYNAYQILKLESFDSAHPGNLIYKVSDDWEGFANTKEFEAMFTVDDQGYVSLKTGVSADNNSDAVIAFAKAAAAYAKKEGIVADKTETAKAPEDDSTATTATVTFDKLPLGYYLIDTTLGTLCSLDTTNWEVTMQEKNVAPTNEKKIVENDTSVDENNVNIGDTVNYVSKITAHKGASNYVFHDKMSDGLTWNGKVTVKAKAKDEDPAESTLTAWSEEATTWDYKLIPASDTDSYSDDCTFHIEFNQTYLDTISEDTIITISYSAVLNEDAVIGTNGNTNTSNLEYGNKTGTNKDHTPDSTVTTYTYGFNVLKYTAGANDEETPLAGAKFELHKSTTNNESEVVIDEETKMNLVDVTYEKADPIVPTYQVCTKTGCNNHTHVAEITTDKTGHFVIKGLDEGVYFLKETQAPAGYNTLKDPVKVTITDKDDDGDLDGTYEVKKDDETTAATDHQIKVENKTGTELPSTGGIGTTIFYVLGSILLVGAGILLVVKRRMRAE